MLKIQLLLAATILSFASLATADTVVLRDGTSYLGHLQGGAITFADTQGVKYEFPGPDVQSLVFSSSGDVVTLRNGKSYSGHFTGSDPVAFSDAQGIHYQFPVSDLDAIIFNHAGAAPPPSGAKMIPSGSDLSVRTNETIDSTNSYQGQTYSAAITEDVLDTAGSVAIPAGSPAQLLVRSISTGGAVHSAEVVLDLYSVTLGKKTVHGRDLGCSRVEQERRGYEPPHGGVPGRRFSPRCVDGRPLRRRQRRGHRSARGSWRRICRAGLHPRKRSKGPSRKHSAIPPGKAPGVAAGALEC